MGYARGDFLVNYVDDYLANLVDRFLLVNQQSMNMTLKSSPEDGYYIDYDNKVFQRYYSIVDRIRWGLLYSSIGPNISISHPLYDEQTGLVLVYVDYGYLGYIVLLNYENNELTELDRYITKEIFD
jgi:hypothetical protein